MTAKIDRTSPVLIGGLVGGVLSGIPCVNILNCLCCSLYILAGGVAGWLFARAAAEVNAYPTAGQGAFTGGLAGGLAGVISALLGGVIALAMGAFGMAQDPGEILENLPPDIDPEAAEAIARFVEMFGGPPTMGRIFISALVSLVLGGLFGLIGGAIGCAMARKPPVPEPAAPAPPPYEPPASPPPSGMPGA